MHARCYRITDTVKRVRMHLDREMRDIKPEVVPEHMDAVRAAVRAERLRDLDTAWQERHLSLFDYLTEMWHRSDGTLYMHLPEAQRQRAEKVLEDEGWI